MVGPGSFEEGLDIAFFVCSEMVACEADDLLCVHRFAVDAGFQFSIVQFPYVDIKEGFCVPVLTKKLIVVNLLTNLDLHLIPKAITFFQLA